MCLVSTSFKSETTQFDPNTGGGADANYRFGPGDRLVLFLTGEVEKSMPLTVTRDGFVVIPAVGQVNVAGLTRAQLEDVLYSRLGRVYSGVRRGARRDDALLDRRRGDGHEPGVRQRRRRASRAAIACRAPEP